jgi:ABC-type uncharacterized transport system involved in gliding motility auxiliary subunit
LFLNNIIAGTTSHQEIKLTKMRLSTGSQTTNKSKISISSLALPNSRINLSIYPSPLIHGNISTTKLYISTVLKHLKKSIQNLLTVRITQKVTPRESMSYYKQRKKQSPLLQINLPVYKEPHSYKKVRFLEFPDHTL